jgi:hypothetical protein
VHTPQQAIAANSDRPVERGKHAVGHEQGQHVAQVKQGKQGEKGWKFGPTTDRTPIGPRYGRWREVLLVDVDGSSSATTSRSCSMRSCKGGTRSSSTGLAFVEQQAEQRLQQRLQQSKVRLSCSREQRASSPQSDSVDRGAHRTLVGNRSKARPCSELAPPRPACIAIQPRGNTWATKNGAGCTAKGHGKQARCRGGAKAAERQHANCHEATRNAPGEMLDKSLERCPDLSWVRSGLTLQKHDEMLEAEGGRNLDNPRKGECLWGIKKGAHTMHDRSKISCASLRDPLHRPYCPVQCVEQHLQVGRRSGDVSVSGISACKRLQDMLVALS